ncbi:signal peptidase II [Patescibacteria group bacterium]|nr:signal peptidase II [Patescibacteria group bacterium]
MSKFWKKIILGYVLVFVFFVLDRIIKYWLLQPEARGAGILTLSKNQGIAFGIPLQGLFLYILVGLILAGLFYLALKFWQKKNTGLHLATVLIIVGALSNLIDRFKFGAVIDYIDLRIWPVFNLADCMIVIGVVMWVLTDGVKKKRN